MNVLICMSNVIARTICKKPLPGLTTGRGVTTTLLGGDNAVRPLRILEAGAWRSLGTPVDSAGYVAMILTTGMGIHRS
jgi:hypothetical protein